MRARQLSVAMAKEGPIDKLKIVRGGQECVRLGLSFVVIPWVCKARQHGDRHDTASSLGHWRISRLTNGASLLKGSRCSGCSTARAH